MNNKGLAIACMACGIASIVTGSVGIGIALGIAAIILSSKSKAVNGPTTFGKVGLITGIIGIAYGLPALICTIACGGGLFGAILEGNFEF